MKSNILKAFLLCGAGVVSMSMPTMAQRNPKPVPLGVCYDEDNGFLLVKSGSPGPWRGHPTIYDSDLGTTGGQPVNPYTFSDSLPIVTCGNAARRHNLSCVDPNSDFQPVENQLACGEGQVLAYSQLHPDETVIFNSTSQRPFVSIESANLGECNVEGGSYFWTWTNPDTSSICGTQTVARTVNCTSSRTNQIVADSFCDPADRPASTVTVNGTQGCGFDYVVGAWSVPAGPACGEVQETRSVSCTRGDGTPASDSDCANWLALPPGASPGSLSSYGLIPWTFPSSGWMLSNVFIHRMPSACDNLDDFGRYQECDVRYASEPPSRFTNAYLRPKDSRTLSYGVACPDPIISYEGYSWNTPVYSVPGGVSTCGPNVMNGSVYCVQESTGTVVADTLCDPSLRPPSSIEFNDESGCQPDPDPDPNPNPPTDPVSTTYVWSSSPFVDPGPNCGNETWTRSVVCRREDNNQLVDDSLCDSSQRPPSTEIRADSSGCSFNVSWGPYSFDNTCSATATRSRSGTCVRADNVIVDPSECTSRGISLFESNVMENFSGCTYNTVPSLSECVDGFQSVTNSCVRVQTGENVDISFCGVPASTNQACTSHKWVTEPFGPFGACQQPGIQYQYRNVFCQRNVGNTASVVDDSFCSGSKPSTENSAGCSIPDEVGGRQIGRICDGGVVIGASSCQFIIGGGVGNSTGYWDCTFTGVLNVNGNTMSDSPVSVDRCLAAGGTCFESERFIETEFGMMTAGSRSSSRCLSSPSVPIEDPVSETYSQFQYDSQLDQRADKLPVQP